MRYGNIIDNYVFNKTAKTVTFSDYDSIRLEGVKLITNVTTGDIIYQFNKAAKGGTVSSNVLTLDYDTSAMADADKLMILYEEPRNGIIGAFFNLLQSISDTLLNPPYIFWGTQGQRLAVQFSSDSVAPTIAAVTTVTTVSAVTNLTNINGLDSRELYWASQSLLETQAIRGRIT